MKDKSDLASLYVAAYNNGISHSIQLARLLLGEDSENLTKHMESAKLSIEDLIPDEPQLLS